MATEPTAVEMDGFVIEGNSGTPPDELKKALTQDDSDSKEPEKSEAQKKSEAAAELGKAGGKASAEKRAEERKAIKPIPPKKDAAPADPEKGKEPSKEETEDEKKVGKDADEGKDKSGHPRHDPQARVEQATRQASEAKKALETERAEHKRQIEELRDEFRREMQSLREGKDPEKPKRPFDPLRPVPEDFDNHEDYLDARDEYNRARWTNDHRTYTLQQEVESERARGAADFFKAVSEAGVVDSLSDEVVNCYPHMPPYFYGVEEGERPSGQNWIANEFMLNPETAPSLALYLSEHSDEFQRIAALPTARDVSREMAKIEARLEDADSGTISEPEESQAPPPVKPVAGEAYTADKVKYTPGMDADEYIRQRDPKLYARLKR